MSSTATKVITPIATLSYPHLDVPQKPQDGKGKEKYSATFVFAPGTDLRELEAAAFAAAEEKYPGKGGEMLRKGILKSPFRKDAEAKGYADGSVFLNTRSEQKPGAVYRWAGPDGKKPANIPAEKVKDELYAGAQVKGSLRAFTYDTQGNKGVSFALNNVQKIADGERIDGRRAAEDEFDADLSSAPADLAGLI